MPSIEYDAACYVLALPEVFKVVPDNIEFDWTRRYDEEYEEFMQTEALLSMEEGDKQLVLAADNLFSGLSFFLKDGLDHWMIKSLQFSSRPARSKAVFNFLNSVSALTVGRRTAE
ncbi:DUF2538 family protein [Paenibacillus allorhizosphaerae]|uniref:Uncharacterized protein n=1 Tax=Paenibacillus allorhizosphaerae TaxID=2849866 RepID=A0ABN7TX22_9BACL|nr:DUF2538 family protein [Paenibacillus allorhizosphaerae]CAG7658974.1 hypothetical protein PAECIP111802_07235 [Paenibacillus allorhizosphaerae]